MAARTPRRTFAHPFVVTLAAVPACTSAPPPAPPTANPPPPTTSTVPTVPTTPDPESAPPAPPPEPAPDPAQQAPDFTQRWTVTKDGATCSARLQFKCPASPPGQPPRRCNPPPPRAYDCPPDMTGASLTVVRHANTTHCVIERAPVKCPPGVRCNPPPPRRVACPK